MKNLQSRLGKPITMDKVLLHPSDYQPISSKYLDDWKQQDRWRLGGITIGPDGADTIAHMQNYYGSSNPAIVFHLSSIVAIEMSSQLFIISLHYLLGLREKQQEVWQIKCVSNNVMPITNPKAIHIQMKPQYLKQRNHRIYSRQHFKLFDSNGGLAEIELTGAMDLN